MRSGELKPEQAATFANSMRGQFIVSKALFIAMKALDNPELPMQERAPSDAADMKYLLENMWPLYAAVDAAEQQFANEAVLRRAKKISD